MTDSVQTKQLYQLKAGDKFKIEGHEGPETFIYNGRIDGAYGRVDIEGSEQWTFLAAWTPVIEVI